MPANVVRLADYRAARTHCRTGGQRLELAILEMQPAPGAVRFEVGDELGAIELWLSPEEARRVASDLAQLAGIAEVLR